MLVITFTFITLQALTLVKQSFQECYDIDPPDHSQIRFGRSYLWYQVSCNNGYILHGNPVVYCENNEWNNPRPTCVEDSRACQDFQVPENAVVNCDTGPLTPGKKCRIECKRGYKLHGVTVKNCLPNYQWSGPYTSCKPMSERSRDSLHSERRNAGNPHQGGSHRSAAQGDDPCANHKCQQLCKIENGRAQCRCNKGFLLNQTDQTSCIRNTGKPIHKHNPCLVNNGGCDHKCAPAPNGKVFCTCRDGYKRGGPKFEKCFEIVSEPVRAVKESCQSNNGGCQHICSDTGGNVQCSCKEGYELDTNGKQCIEIIYVIKEFCHPNNGGCHHFCSDAGTEINVQCSCKEGYKLHSNGKHCIEIASQSAVKESCQSNNGGCHHFCSDTEENVQCSCEEGYKLHPNGKHCNEIVPEPTPPAEDSCKSNNGGCEHFCSDTDTNVQCSCVKGFELNTNGKSCIDIDECSSKNLNNCEHLCGNLRGTYECSCQPGYVLVDGHRCEDIDECSRKNLNNCQHFCENQVGSYTCSCRPGYALVNGRRCEDINECSSKNLNNCQHFCSNRMGSYTCSCQPGFVLVDGYRCEDIDECASENLNNCQHFCGNQIGSYSCFCKPGYVLMDGHKCQGCGENSYWSFEQDGCTQCPKYSHTDSEGKTSIKDCVCNPGFIGNPGDGVPCKDIDECLTENFGCSDTCVNIPGSAYCSCQIGFELDIDNKTCIDTDECSVKNGGCEGNCENLHGSFKCTCLEGFKKSNKDHYSCEDVDECLENNGGCEQKCINYRGGYHCACEKGRLDSSLKNCTDSQCSDLPVTPHSYIICRKDGQKLGEMESYPIGTICTFKCQRGFKVRDSKDMKCLEDGKWDGDLPMCEAHNCPLVKAPENGAVHPPFCSRRGNSVKEKCVFTCNKGYRLEGNAVLTCKNSLKWSHEVPVCQLEEIEPRIECPLDITVTLLPGRNTQNITLGKPKTNVEFYTVDPVWVSVGKVNEFPAGVTKVTFTTIPSDSNKTANCIVTIAVLDKEPPVFHYCPDPISIEGTGVEGIRVTWDEPIVSDNVEIESVYSVSKPNTTLTPGTYIVEYIARDIYGNIASCSFNISINRVICLDLPDPAHGEAICMDWMYGKFCQPHCDDGYMQYPDSPAYYSCDDTGIWEPSDTIGECLQFTNATSSSCPDGFVLITDDETAEEICLECPSNTVWSATTKECEETRK